MNQAIVRGLRKAGVIVATATASGLAAAQTGGPDMTAMTSAIDFGTVTTAVLSIAGLLAVVYVAMKGATLALSMVKK